MSRLDSNRKHKKMGWRCANTIYNIQSSVIGGFFGNLFFARKSFCPLARVGRYIGRDRWEEIVVEQNERKRDKEKEIKGKIERERKRDEMAGGGDGRRKGNPFADVCYEVHPPAHSSSPR